VEYRQLGSSGQPFVGDTVNGREDLVLRGVVAHLCPERSEAAFGHRQYEVAAQFGLHDLEPVVGRKAVSGG